MTQIIHKSDHYLICEWLERKTARLLVTQYVLEAQCFVICYKILLSLTSNTLHNENDGLQDVINYITTKDFRSQLLAKSGDSFEPPVAVPTLQKD